MGNKIIASYIIDKRTHFSSHSRSMFLSVQVLSGTVVPVVSGLDSSLFSIELEPMDDW